MDNWIQIGSRYLNLANVNEVRVQEQPREAHVFFAGGGALQLDEDDTLALVNLLQEEVTIARPVRKTISAPIRQS